MATVTTNESNTNETSNNNTNDNNILLTNVPAGPSNGLNSNITPNNINNNVGIGLAVYTSSNMPFLSNTNNNNNSANFILNNSQQSFHNYPTSMNNARNSTQNLFLTKFNNSNQNRMQSNLNTQAQSISYLISSNSNNQLSSDSNRLNQNIFNSPSSSLNYNFSSTSSTSVSSKPTSSSISSSSKSAIATSSSVSSGQNLALTSRDWFSFVYKIENIEDLIKPTTSINDNNNQLNLNQQNFVQSPVFSFTNHLIYSNLNNNMSSNSSKSQNDQTSSSNYNSISGSSSSNSDSNILSEGINSNFNNNNNTTNTKKTSNWRLIFYPNGAGADCKNFLSIFLKYLSDEPVKIQMMFSIVDNNNQDIYVKYTVNKFNKSNDWGFKQLIHKNAILFQKEKFLKPYNGGTLSVRVRMRLDEQKNDYIKKLNDNLHYCKLLSENFSQYYYNNLNQQENNNNNNNFNQNETNTSDKTQFNLTNNKEQVKIDSHQTLSSTILQSADSIDSKNLSNQSNIVNKLIDDNYFTNSSYYDLILLVKSENNNNDDLKDSRNNVNCNNRRGFIEDCQINPSKKFKSDQKITSNHNKNEQFIEIKAHKCILAARSPVFKAMFNYKLKENLTNKLVIEDCKPDVIRAMLKYIYTAYIPDDIKNIAIDLYIAAEKYFIESLKIKCREFLAENLSTESVIHTFILSELYNDSMLRKQSLKFISENIEKVTQNSDWNDFMVAYPQYFTNAFIRLCKKDF